MAKTIHWEPSRTLHEFRLLPGLTTPDAAMDNITLRTPLVSTPESDSGAGYGCGYRKAPSLWLNIESTFGPRFCDLMKASVPGGIMFSVNTVPFFFASCI